LAQVLGSALAQVLGSALAQVLLVQVLALVSDSV
jgi:hypothetical protein